MFSQEIADKICKYLEDGKSLRAACREIPGAPSPQTVLTWEATNKEFAEQYTRARNTGLDIMAQEILDIANTPHEGVIITDKPTGREVQTRDAIDHRRLQVDTRKWYLSKLAPKRYGEKLNVDHAGGISIRVVTGVPDEGEHLL